MSGKKMNNLPHALALLACLSTLAAPAAEPTVNGVRPLAREPSMAFSPDGRFLALLDGRGPVRIWDVGTGKERKKIPLDLGPGEFPERVRYTSGGDLVVLLCRYKGFKSEAGTATEGTISASLWNLVTGKRSPPIEIWYTGVAISPKGEVLAYDRALWDVASAKKLHNVALPPGLVIEIGFSPDGKTVLYRISESLAQDFALLFLADAATGKKLLQIGEIDLEKHSRCGFFSGPKVSPDGKLVAFSQRNRRALHVWDVARSKAVHVIPLKESEDVVGFGPDGRTLVTWRRPGGSLRLWETATGKQRRAVKVAAGLDAVLLSPDGKTVALRKGKAVELRALRD